MHIDFSHYLIDAIRREFGKLSEAEFRRISRVQVECCPVEQGRVLSSPVSFQVSSLLSKGGERVEPLVVAERIVAALQDATGSTENFELEIGGQGHINATPSAPYVRNYLLGLQKGGASRLLSTEPIGITAMQSVVEPLAEFKLEAILGELLSRGAERREPEFSALQSRIEKNLTSVDLLMLLGLLSDDEISLGPYFRNEGRSENVPWYFDKFSRDWKKFVDLCSSRLENSSGSGELKQLEIDWTWESADWALGNFTWERVIGLLSFREVLFRSLTRKQPEQLIAFLRGVVHAFYDFYNHPETRAIRGTVFAGDEEVQFFRDLVKLNGELVEQSLGLVLVNSETAG